MLPTIYLIHSTSEIFNYKRSDFVSHSLIDSDPTVDLNSSYPWKTKHHQMGIKIQLDTLIFPVLVVKDLFNIVTHPENVYFGVHFIFHNTDELITKSSLNQRNFFGSTGGTTLYWIKPEITQIDDSLISTSPDE